MYLGEIISEVKKIISCNFRADKPYETLLTDITEFAFPNGELYRSARIDCFDGMIVGWKIGSRPNADLSDGLYIQTEAAIIGWPGWIGRMKEAGLTRSILRRAVPMRTQHVKVSLDG